MISANEQSDEAKQSKKSNPSPLSDVVPPHMMHAIDDYWLHHPNICASCRKPLTPLVNNKVIHKDLELPLCTECMDIVLRTLSKKANELRKERELNKS